MSFGSTRLRTSVTFSKGRPEDRTVEKCRRLVGYVLGFIIRDTSFNWKFFTTGVKILCVKINSSRWRKDNKQTGCVGEDDLGP